MTNKSIIKIKDEKHWHELRHKHIGGSDIAALFGASSYSTPYELYHEKRGVILENVDKPLTKLGKIMESFIADYISETYNWRIVKCEEYLEHPKYKTLGCTLDYYVVKSEKGPGILEVKNVQAFSPGWTETRASEYVEWQVQHQLLVANSAREASGHPPFKWAAIGSMHAGNPEDIRIMMREPDEKAQKAIIQRNAQFWNDVENDNPPPIQGSKDYDTIVDMFKIAEKKETVLDMRDNKEIDAIVDRFYKKKEERKNIEKEEKALKSEIMSRLLVDDVAHIAGRTEHYVINIKQGTSIKKPQPERKIKTIRLNIKLSDQN